MLLHCFHRLILCQRCPFISSLFNKLKVCHPYYIYLKRKSVNKKGDKILNVPKVLNNNPKGCHAIMEDLVSILRAYFSEVYDTSWNKENYKLSINNWYIMVILKYTFWQQRDTIAIMSLSNRVLFSLTGILADIKYINDVFKWFSQLWLLMKFQHLFWSKGVPLYIMFHWTSIIEYCEETMSCFLSVKKGYCIWDGFIALAMGNTAMRSCVLHHHWKQ